MTNLKNWDISTYHAIHHFKVYNSMVFSVFTKLCRHYQYLIVSNQQGRMGFFWGFYFLAIPCGMQDLSPPGIKPVPPAVEAWSLNHWTIGPVFFVFCFLMTHWCLLLEDISNLQVKKKICMLNIFLLLSKTWIQKDYSTINNGKIE